MAVAVWVTFTLKPGAKREDLIKAYQPRFKDVSENEPLTYVYAAHFHKNPNQVFFYEFYPNAEALETHKKNLAKFAPSKETLDALLEGPPKIEALPIAGGKLPVAPSASTDSEHPEIAVGAHVPSVKFTTTVDGNIKVISSNELFDKKKVVVFAVPGPFTPGCTQAHLPGFAQATQRLREKGVDTVACLAVADPYVMQAWKEANTPKTDIIFLSDHTGEFTRQIGLGTTSKIGVRSKRYAFVINNGVLVHKLVDYDNKVKESGAESVLSKL